MRISFKLNKEYDTELIKQLEKFKEGNLSQVIRKILRDNLVYRKIEIEDVFAEDNKSIKNEVVSNTNNVNETIEIRQINRKAEINNSNTSSNNTNKSKPIKWNIPE